MVRSLAHESADTAIERVTSEARVMSASLNCMMTVSYGTGLKGSSLSCLYTAFPQLIRSNSQFGATVVLAASGEKPLFWD